VAIGRNEVDVLRRAGWLPARQYGAALALVRDAAFWARWARHALLALGLGHLLAGAVFFFAYNWADLPDLAKFATVEAGIAAAALAALWRGADRPEGAAALVAATVLTGVLFAVIGQVYQTGADPWQFFALWAALALPWALASGNAAHWLVWLVVLHVAAVLYLDAALVQTGRLGELQALVAVSLLPLVVLAAREALVARGLAAWAAAGWTRLVPGLAGIIGLALGTGQILLGDTDGSGGALWSGVVLAPAAFLAALAVLAVVYRRVFPDLPMLAAVTGFAALFLIGLGARVLAQTIGFDEGIETILPSLGLLIFWSVAVVAGAARLLEHLRRTMAAAHG
jgi:hypothetical protein